jgi:hypothetical protein
MSFSNSNILLLIFLESNAFKLPMPVDLVNETTLILKQNPPQGQGK